MTYQDFRRLLTAASEFESAEAYIAEEGGSVPESVSDAALIPLLERLYAFAHDRSAAGLRRLTGLSQAAFARAYSLPLRTVECWEMRGANGRKSPPYVLDLLAYAVLTAEIDEDVADA